MRRNRSIEDTPTQMQLEFNQGHQQERLMKRRHRATERERIRMHYLNEAFDQLRLKLSFLPVDRRKSLSKQQTLTLARCYIVELSQILQD
ncbi:Protein dimmed [Trichoplax sp. H2]|nr:Protein dimmed [Trichoplax sp. H2]|eukprot:RDD40058.1 Protein dimmed [Trichoplax sp. H2]